MFIRSGPDSWFLATSIWSVSLLVFREENDIVPKVLEAILNLPENTHIAVRFTSLLLLGELCEWIEKHPQVLGMLGCYILFVFSKAPFIEPHWILFFAEPVLNMVLYCLQQPQLANAAANCLQSICTSCREHMASRFAGLLQILQSLDKFSITNEAAVGLLKGKDHMYTVNI